MGTVGIVANPLAGTDIRRLVARASGVSDATKVSIVERVAVGAVEGGATRLLVMPDGKDLCRRAIEPLDLDVAVEPVDVPVTGDRVDTELAAEAMAKAEAGALVTLGGDGTCRDVVKGWPDAPLVALSTGTNNVFPRAVEPTIAGLAAGLVASGRVGAAAVADRANLIHASVAGEETDLALVDLMLLDGRFVGSRAVWDAGLLRAAVVAIAEPTAVGLSAVAAAACRHRRDEAGGLTLRFGSGGTVVRAPVAPGLFADVTVASVEHLAEGAAVTWEGPGVLSFDGERDRVLDAGQSVDIEIRRDGPFVIDVARAVDAALAARKGA